ncbi:MAG: hypothetical protein AAGH15_22645 [Myxococcota bacterium]
MWPTPANRPEQPTPSAEGEAILGRAPAAIARHLREAGGLRDVEVMPLAEQVRIHVQDHRRRARYVANATRHLRAKRLRLEQPYDVVLVGAGIHAAMFVYTAKRLYPELRALVVEKSSTACSTFAELGDSLILNSPTSSRVGLNSNVAQGHFVQISDFDELTERTFPTAKHLHELSTMILFHADADVLFDFHVDDVAREGPESYAVSSGDRRVHADAVVIANGMGEPKRHAFATDRHSERIVLGDEFIRRCHDDDDFLSSLSGKAIAIAGAGDTANCVMECLLPLTYPRERYDTTLDKGFEPSVVFWIGQTSNNVRDYYFANKQRYCYSGGLIEYFWDGDGPFDLPADAWSRTKARLKLVPDKLVSVSHEGTSLELDVGSETLEADMVVDCTGRFNALSAVLLGSDYTFVRGDVTLFGGQWDGEREQFVLSPRSLDSRRVAVQCERERVYLIGCACPLEELIEDDEARDGSLVHQDSRTSITNSKWSLEHTLPRSVAFAERFARALRTRQGKRA